MHGNKNRLIVIHRPQTNKEGSMSLILSIIRNALLAIGSGGAVAGWFTDQEWATVVSAALVIGSAIWKWIERRKHVAE